METTLKELLNSINVRNHTVKHALSSDHEVVQCSLVRGEYFRANYEDWVQHSKPCVRKLIAETYPEYVPLLPCETDWELIAVGNYLLEQTKPKLEVFEKFLSKIELLNPSVKTIAFGLKYETLTREMTAIEKTMSLKQLWQSGSPFWTEKLTGTQVVRVLRAYTLNEQALEEFDIESAVEKVTNSLTERLNSATPYVTATYLDEILNKGTPCNKILTPLIC